MFLMSRRTFISGDTFIRATQVLVRLNDEYQKLNMFYSLASMSSVKMRRKTVHGRPAMVKREDERG